MAIRPSALIVGGVCLLFASSGVPAPRVDAHAPGQDAPGTLPACSGDVPFPPDIRLIEPAPDLPAESAALVGVWQGSFAEGANPSAGVAATIVIGAAVRLAVEEVLPGRARIVLGLGTLGGSPGTWTAGTVPMAAGRLDLGTNPLMLFVLGNDRQTLNGTVDRAGGRSGVRMTRCTMGEAFVPRPAAGAAAR